MGFVGFFKPSELAKIQAPLTGSPKCGACGFYKTCNTPKMPVYGEGRKRILIVSSSPGKEEDESGRQYVGPIGRFVKKELRAIGIDVDKDCWLTYSMICHPENYSPKRIQVAVDSCRPNVFKTIKELDPVAILLLGGDAVASVIPIVWKKSAEEIDRWFGLNIPAQVTNSWICPTYNPAFVLKEQDRQNNTIPLKAFRAHLAKFAERTERPWKNVPDWEKKIRIFTDSTEDVRKEVQRFIEANEPCAFDYEANMLKPEGKQATIVSCSISDGKRTIAYPMIPETIEATKEFLYSPVPKIAANMKFEARWTKVKFGRAPRNLVFDTMIAAHILDCRRGNKSLKFQALAFLGQPSWNNHIDHFLDATETMKPNKILTHISLRDLLLYNGMDSLLEWKLWKLFSQKLGVT